MVFMSFFVVCSFSREAFCRFSWEKFCGLSWEELADKSNYFCQKRGPRKIARKNFSSVAILGGATLNNVKVYGSLLVTGPAVIIKSTFNKLVVRGSLGADGSYFNSAFITGPLLLESCIVKEKLIVNGPLNASNSVLNDISIVPEGKIIFDTSSASTLLVRENILIKPHVVEIFLKGKSSIKTIEFEPGVKGIVILEDKTACVGTVKNGIIKKNFR